MLAILPKYLPIALGAILGLGTTAAQQQKLDALLLRHASEVKRVRENETRLDSPEFSSIRTALDKAANQRDAYASGLHWFTDLEEAKNAARNSGKPILSLRLLGRLDEEYSCANSRFFRTLLYADPQVSSHLRNNYVLHWKSQRPAPLLTIDMGDGRRVRRTVTGNSIHYVLDKEGFVVDALPGLYSPLAFLAALGRAEAFAIGKTAAEQRIWHGAEASALCQEWLMTASLAGVYGEILADSGKPEELRTKLKQRAPKAFPSSSKPHLLEFNFNPSHCTSRFASAVLPVMAAKRESNVPVIREFPYPNDFDLGFDPPKGMVERPILQRTTTNALPALDPASPQNANGTLAGSMTAAAWAKMGERFLDLVKPSIASRKMMLQKQPADTVDSQENQTGIPLSSKTSFGRMLDKFTHSVASDMVRNEYFYHTQLHQWLEEDSTGALAKDMEALNTRVYSELFLTPDYDAWLGLMPEDTYSALEKDGCACDPDAAPMRDRANKFPPK